MKALLKIFLFLSLSIPTLFADTNLEFQSFCRDRLMSLKHAYNQAERQYQIGNNEMALSLLESGLVVAGRELGSRYTDAFTAKIINRGVLLMTELKGLGSSTRNTRTLTYFLFNYYHFIEEVSNTFDFPYYTPRRGHASHSNPIQFERLFIKLSSSQMRLILETMTDSSFERGGKVTYPIGSVEALLTALDFSARSMAKDFSESLFSARYACTIQKLVILSDEITQVLNGSSSYPSNFIAVQEIVGMANELIHPSGYCGMSGDMTQNAPTSDSLSTYIRLHSGTTEILRLSSSRHIKKLIVSAEGANSSDAIFDVVVNGDIKGTIYVPGRDPSYFVTVEDFADSIVFVSRNGTALITKVIVISE